MSNLGAVLKANKESNEVMEASVAVNLGSILSANKEKAQERVKNAATKKRNEKFFENAVDELLMDAQIGLLQIEVAKQIFEGNEKVEIEFRGDMNITGDSYFDKNGFSKFLLKPQAKEFLKWLNDNSLALEVVSAHDGVGVHSWVDLYITHTLTTNKRTK